MTEPLTFTLLVTSPSRLSIADAILDFASNESPFFTLISVDFNVIEGAAISATVTS